MKKKKWTIFIVVIGIIMLAWGTGIIPKQIAKVSGTKYVNEHFPKMQLEYVGVELADVFGDYLITFKDIDGNMHSCVIGPKYLPVTMGQGLFDIESLYFDANDCSFP